MNPLHFPVRRFRSRRAVIGAIAALGSIAAMPLAAQEAYPARPIRFIVPATAGGATDLVARTVGARMARTLGQSVLIDNRGGAGGNIGMDTVAKAAPDGYTIGMGAMSTNALNPHLYKKMPFDPRTDFTAIGMLGNSTIVLETGPALPVGSVAELLAHVRHNPGTSFATAGAGTSMHLAGALFAQLSRTEWVHVPYKGSAPLITDLMAGHVPVAFDLLPASLPSIEAGKLRALAVAGSRRSPSLPDVPTLAEAGLTGYTVEPWFGVFGPAGIPAPVARRLNQALREALDDPEVKEKLLAAGFSPRPSTAAELEALAAHEYERLGKVARSAKMTAD
jgi:tripartite-type tricarboxylate transporter receptor subunit TctC